MSHNDGCLYFVGWLYRVHGSRGNCAIRPADGRSARYVLIDGKQYIAVTTGSAAEAPRDVPRVIAQEIHHPGNGNALYVFTLCRTMRDRRCCRSVMEAEHRAMDASLQLPAACKLLFPDMAREYQVSTHEPPRLPSSVPVRRGVNPSVRRLADWMDEAIRIGPISVGIDGILGLIPGFGDLLSSFVSFYIVYQASLAGAPRALLARMMSNIAIDTMLGAVPFLGDLFDFVWKANTKNVRLLDEWAAGRHRTEHDWLYVITAIVSVIAAVAIPVVVLIVIIRAVLH